MARITAEYEVAKSLTVEFEGKLYFRVEILRSENHQDVQTIEYTAEVYQLRLPGGAVAFPSAKEDRRFRQFWMYLEELPKMVGHDVPTLCSQVMARLSEYSDADLARYPETRLQRVKA
jgi:hypothetical protein